jgi:hypothetical protein
MTIYPISKEKREGGDGMILGMLVWYEYETTLSILLLYLSLPHYVNVSLTSLHPTTNEDVSEDTLLSDYIYPLGN